MKTKFIPLGISVKPLNCDARPPRPIRSKQVNISQPDYISADVETETAFNDAVNNAVGNYTRKMEGK